MKNALITGASGEIGSAIARALAAAGCRVWLHANVRINNIQTLAQEIVAGGGEAVCVRFDVCDADDCRARLDEILAEIEAFDIVVNNAGIHDDAAFPAMSAEKWQRVLAVTLDGFFNVTQPLVMPMVRRRWGRIINISSVSALLGNRGQVNYAAAKGALNAATRALSHELASRAITVNAIAPGVIEGPMSAASFAPERIRQLVPAQRAGRPEEVAALAAFLASDAAAYITGQVISINGGMI